MPKHGKSVSGWKSRLRDNAAGNFKFGQCQKPLKNSSWAKEICLIYKCPAVFYTKKPIWRYCDVYLWLSFQRIARKMLYENNGKSKEGYNWEAK
jgi:hypothetical protein